ncbi:hypothetical protein AQUCO_00100171v1 [Aquilegia coerulea]|uniref:Glycoside hydrolase family 5 domain-containing protein n=1 Tax=Aquilegia coerulea TaxID=218851 RepID=A0A2G5F992_AQUCA|nr:hypothetical protein AQUCO_00100171v1 [Aquilegia coerulea]
MPLYTNSRWIVNEKGKRVKLACVNWPSHLETLLAEGLNKSPVDEISKKIVATGFNCVRFTWPVALATNESLQSTTAENWFNGLGLDVSIAGIKIHNADFLSLTLIQAYQAVVSNLGDNNVMVILDNHISKPGWCCAKDDGNGFFGDEFFDPELWLKGLTKMATLFKDTKNVVGMSLRNELRGNNQNVSVWHRYMQEGAETVHSANPKVLVILSGISFDNDLGFLRGKPVNITFTKKLVFEVHRYGVSIGSGWQDGNPNDVCGNFMNTLMSNAGFLMKQGYPLFLSEFGGDQRGTNVNDNRFLNCMFSVVADLDLDWGLWTFQGSYYMREGEVDMEEMYGVLNRDWSEVRNESYMVRVNSIQFPHQGPGLFHDQMAPYNIIYHPSTGFCVQNNSSMDQLSLGLCEESTAWMYNTTQKTIMMSGADSCLQAVEMGTPVQLGGDCSNFTTSMWEMISDSKLHLSSNLTNGDTVCMDIDNGVVIASPCRCLKEDTKCDPSSQWFKIIESRRESRLE